MKPIAALLLSSLTLAQQSATTSAPCSPIAPDNTGTITIKCPGMPKEQWQTLLSILNKIQANQVNPDLVMSRLDQLIETQAELKKLIDSLGDSVKPETLLAKYPLGYMIFEVGYTEQVFPYQTAGLADITIDWNTARVTNLSNDQVSLRYPDIKVKQSNNIFSGNFTGVDKRMKPGPLVSWTLDKFTVVSELLSVKNEGIVLLVGVKPAAQMWNTQPRSPSTH